MTATITPVQASEIRAGDVLQAQGWNGLPPDVRASCLVLTAFSDADCTVLNLLVALAGDYTDGQCDQRATTTIPAGMTVGRFTRTEGLPMLLYNVRVAVVAEVRALDPEDAIARFCRDLKDAGFEPYEGDPGDAFESENDR